MCLAIPPDCIWNHWLLPAKESWKSQRHLHLCAFNVDHRCLLQVCSMLLLKTRAWERNSRKESVLGTALFGAQSQAWLALAGNQISGRQVRQSKMGGLELLLPLAVHPSQGRNGRNCWTTAVPSLVFQGKLVLTVVLWYLRPVWIQFTCPANFYLCSGAFRNPRVQA